MDAERRRSHPGVASQGEASLARRGGELGERGVGFEQILACRLDAAGVVGVDTAADQRTVGSTDRALDHVAHVRVGGWAQRVEHGGTVEPRTMEDSVRRQQVEVRSEGEIGGEALDVGDGGGTSADVSLRRLRRCRRRGTGTTCATLTRVHASRRSTRETGSGSAR